MGEDQMRGQMAGDGAGRLRIDRRKLQRTLGPGDILAGLRGAEPVTNPADVEPGDWKEGLKPIRTRPSDDGDEQVPHGNRETPMVVEEAAIATFMQGGKTMASVEQMFALRKGFLGLALRRRYADIPTLKKALVGQSLENSLILQEYAIAHMDELSPAQALLGSKITADTAVAIEKSEREAPKAIDFGSLSELGAALAAIEGILKGEGGDGERAEGLNLTPSDPNPVTRY
jgi:hypothetical protein